MNIRVILLIIFFIFIIFLPVFYYIYDTDVIFLNNLNFYNKKFDIFFNENLPLTIFLVFCILVISIVINIPGNSLKAIFVGFYFGPFLGSFLIISTITLGSYIFYYLLNKKIIKSINFTQTNYQRILNNNFRNKYSWIYLIGLRIVPIIPLPVQNILVSAIDISNFKFIATTFLGISPLLIIYTLIGSQLSSIIDMKLIDINSMILSNFILLLFLIFVVFLIGLVIYILEKKYVK